MTGINVEELFADAKDPADLSLKFDGYLGALGKAPNTARGDVRLAQGNDGGQTLVKVESVDTQFAKLLADQGITKALGADVMTSVTQALDMAREAQGDITKDLTLTSPLATGYVAYDLEGPAKMLTPRPTPLRNRISRTKGQGTSLRYKRITGFTGTGTGGVGIFRPGITDSTTTQFGAINYLRGPKISYAGDEANVPYLQFGVSDQVPWSAQYASQGFQDLEQLSQTAVLYSSMLLEERLLLAGRGTAAGFLGALAAPSGITVTARAAGAGEVGASVPNTVYVKVSSDAMYGDSTLSGVTSVALTVGQVADVKVGNDAAGANGYRIYAAYAGADPGDAARALQGRTGYNTFTLFASASTLTPVSAVSPGVPGYAASLVTVDTSASPLDYDGILTVCAGPNSGYTTRLNGAFSSTNPGTEFQTAFAQLYDSVKADPDRALMNGFDRKQLSDLLKTASSSNYRLTVVADGSDGKQLGNVVTAIQNEVTGKVIDLEVHPWLPQGNVPIVSDTLPLPDSEISDVWQVRNVQDYMAVKWPVTQFAHEFSSYWFGTMACFAPAWNGCIQGVKKI